MSKKKSVEKIYLDVCTICRPYDDQSYLRIRLETDAYYLILNYVKSSRFVLMVSPVHYYELKSIENDQERISALSILGNLGVHINCDRQLAKQRTEELIAKGFGLGDGPTWHLPRSGQSISCHVMKSW
ncbi:MAG: hypothetical protein GQF41_0510 [Candidatus Rifleibacterium amylolyticum]|nr:MAG: hypothetical protein GQF41_0510 [Candidatus Rifleibacterium amylolyticum]